MALLVLTVTGRDRAGLVTALAENVAEHGGNWERSHLTELAGRFAGVVVVSVPDDRAAGLTETLGTMSGLLDVTVHPGQESAAPEPTRRLAIEVVGNDRPGIVHHLSAVLARHRVTIAELDSRSWDAPMSGGRLFEARITALLPDGTDPGTVRGDLEGLADELLVDLTIGDAASTSPADSSPTAPTETHPTPPSSTP